MFEGAASEEPPPVLLRLGTRIISVTDTGDGSAARRFAELLLGGGARSLTREGAPPADHRIVIRAPLPAARWRLRAVVLEESADVVLGSVRPAFAALFASACTVGVNS
ncbi:MAG: hypothetical protein WAU39_11410 [Polyangiales bacterium]